MKEKIKDALLGMVITTVTGMIVTKGTDILTKLPSICGECKKLGKHKAGCSKFRPRIG